MPKYLNRIIESGGEIALMRRGKPVAKVVAYDEKDNRPWEKYFGFLPDDGITGAKFEDSVRRTKKDREYTKSLTKR